MKAFLEISNTENSIREISWKIGNILEKYKILFATNTLPFLEKFWQIYISNNDWQVLSFQDKNSQNIKEMGTRLFQILFPKEKLFIWEKIFSLSVTEICILGGEDLPLEALFYPGQGYIAKKISIIRKSKMDRDIKLTTCSPLRVLIAVASPMDKERLNYEWEIACISQIFYPLVRMGKVELEVLYQTTKEKLSEKLRKFSPHIVHLSCHGFFSFLNQRNGILLETTEGISEKIEVGKLQVIFSNSSELILTFLAVCHSSCSLEKISNISQTLSENIPYVIGMAEEIEDITLTELASNFFKFIVLGETVGTALAKARNALKTDEMPYWAFSVLFSYGTTTPFLEKAVITKFYSPSSDVFVGRNNELRKIQKILSQTRSLSIYGPLGIGKSCLAVKIASKLNNHIIEWDEKELSPNTILSFLAKHLGNNKKIEGIISSKLPIQRKLEQAILHISKNSPFTLIINNLENYTKTNKLISNFTRAINILADNIVFPSSLILTHQYPIEFSSPNIISVQLGELGEARNKMFFYPCFRMLASFERDKILSVLGGNPFFLEKFAIFLENNPKHLEQNLEEFSSKKLPPKIIFDLSQEQQDLFGCLAAYPEKVDELAYMLQVKNIFPPPKSEDRKLWKEYRKECKKKLNHFISFLRKHSVIHISYDEEKKLQIFYIPYFIRKLAVEKIKPFLRKKAYLTAACYYEWLGRERERALSQYMLAREYYHLGEEKAKAFKLTLKLQNYLQENGDINKTVGLLQDELQKCDPIHQFKIESQIAGFFWKNGETVEAIKIYEKILKNFGYYCKPFDLWIQGLNDKYSLGLLIEALSNLGLIFSYDKKYDKAIKLYEQSKKIAEKTCSVDAICNLNFQIGLIYREKEDYDEALKMFHKAGEIAKTKKDAIKVFIDIGEIYYRQGKYESALESFRKGLSKAKQAGNIETLGILSRKMGAVLEIQELYDEALQYVRCALTIHRELQNLINVAEDVYRLANIYLVTENEEESLEPYFEAALLFDKLNNNLGKSSVLRDVQYLKQKRPDVFFAFCNKILRKQIKEKCANQIKILKILLFNEHLWDFFKEEEFIDYFDDLLKHFKDIKDEHGIGSCYLKMGKWDKALEHFQKSIEEFDVEENKEMMGITYAQIGFVCRKQKNCDIAIEYFQESLQIWKSLSNTIYVGKIYLELAKIWYIFYEFPSAIDALENARKALKNTDISRICNALNLQEQIYDWLSIVQQEYVIFQNNFIKWILTNRLD